MSDMITTTQNTAPNNTPNAEQESKVQITHVTYALFALGLLSAGTIALAGLILAYIKRDDMSGSYLRSHYDWLTSTFWWSVIWALVIFTFVVLTLGLGLIVAWIPWGLLHVWAGYKIIKGWLRLADKKAIA